MSDRMSLAEAGLYVEPGPVENNMQRAARTIVAAGKVLDTLAWRAAHADTEEVRAEAADNYHRLANALGMRR